MSLVAARLLAAEKPVAEDELTTFKREYADVLALQGTSKDEILAIARILRAKPEIAIDRTAASGEYCLNSGLGTMVHFATQPERTPEDVVYEFDASGLIAAGLDPSRLQQLPEQGRMTPGVWYFLPKGQQDPHHTSNCCRHQVNGREFMLSFYPESPLNKSRNRRNKLSSNCS
jgi:hypothetical protein